MAHKVSFSPEARADLINLYDFIAEQSGKARALAYIERIERWCLGLSTFPERGIKRDDLAAGLRILGFERRAVIAFSVSGNAVIILRILYGGRDIDRNLS